MFDLIGAHFDILVLAGFGLFAACLGTISLTNNLGRG